MGQVNAGTYCARRCMTPGCGYERVLKYWPPSEKKKRISPHRCPNCGQQNLRLCTVHINGHTHLTKRTLEVIYLALLGCQDKEIAQVLRITRSSVSSAWSYGRSCLEVDRNEQLIMEGFRRGLFDFPGDEGEKLHEDKFEKGTHVCNERVARGNTLADIKAGQNAAVMTGETVEPMDPAPVEELQLTEAAELAKKGA